MLRRTFLAASTAPLFAQAPARPNILLILADDLGYGNLGCYGSRDIQTPNLDRLAAQGTRFTQAYAGSTVCAPSRCCLMTGLHTGHAVIRGNGRRELTLDTGHTTITEVLKRAGYRTGLFGKWSLGGLGTSGYPTAKGFDEWFGFFSQTHAHNYYPEHLLENDHEFLLRGNSATQRRDYAHDVILQRCLRFLEGPPNAPAKPFFCKLSLTIPHANNEMGRDTGNGMEVPDTAPYTARNWPAPDKNFAAMITRMDKGIGQILDLLQSRGQLDNTLIVFTSDNGPHREGGHNPDFFDDNGPLRGIKRDLYEGGIRVPAIARWPGHIPAGKVSDQVWAHWDLLPTLASAAGEFAPAGIDGIDMMTAWTGRPNQPQHESLYWEFHERGFQQAVRFGDWKALRLKPGAPLELYNLKTDIGETRNTAAANPGVVKQAEALLAKARTDSPDWPVKAG
ncbi:MAG: arylsulfatase [Acidobacteria bacterium]|nr:arylsulfatase [Acidobacteriota bacterium]